MIKPIRVGLKEVAVVDDIDYELVSRYRWHVDESGFARNNDEVPMHYLVGQNIGIPQTAHIAHKNGDVLDNCRSNLTYNVVIAEAKQPEFPSASIQLTKGAVALVDPEDAEWISEYKWQLHGCGYAVRSSVRTVLMHRAIMQRYGLIQESQIVDHINGNKLDNRKANLRACTYSQNLRNTKKNGTNVSGYRCVAFIKSEARPYVVTINTDERKVRIGGFANVHHAGIIANVAMTVYHGEFANLNEIPIEYQVNPRLIPVYGYAKTIQFMRDMLNKYEAIVVGKTVEVTDYQAQHTASPANEAAVSTGEAA